MVIKGKEIQKDGRLMPVLPFSFFASFNLITVFLFCLVTSFPPENK